LAGQTEVCRYGGGVQEGKKREVRGGRGEEKGERKGTEQWQEAEERVDDEKKEMEEGMDWKEFMVHRVMRVDSGMKVTKRDLVELRSELVDLQEEMAESFEGLQKELKTLREENAELQRGMGVIIQENQAMGMWLRGILCQLRRSWQLRQGMSQRAQTWKRRKMEK
jgi:hypothetical protein